MVWSSLSILVTFRFLSEFVCSPVIATGGSTLVDVWSPKKISYATGVWSIVGVAGPTLGTGLRPGRRDGRGPSGSRYG
ncbi:hypothetical protein LY78DRAFT_585516 [Colletotrichum sublineola]|nr:hypothetical protein LY78DRAFT_585516 [Colletotrichum sublineola]